MINVASRYFLFVLACLAILVVFTIDSITPLGIENWVFYLPIILAMVFFNSPRLISSMAATCTVLVVLARYLSPPGLNPDWWDMVNRGMGLMAIWLTAGAGVAICKRSKQLSRLYQELFAEVESRKRTEQLLRESEERMRLAMENGGFGTRDVNLRNSLEIWSDTHFQICGYEPQPGGVADSQMLDRLVHHEDLKRILLARQQAREGRSLYHVEHRLRRADTQKVVWIEVWGRYYYDQHGEAVRFVGMCFDVSRRKELERKELEREILEITTTQQQLLGQDLHDGLGQELTGLGLMAQTLLLQLPDESLGQRIASRLIVGIEHTHRMVRDLSRGLVAIEVDARGLAPALRGLAKSTTENTGVQVTALCPESFEMSDQATATHVFRIVQEAVSNALRHGRPRTIRVTVCTEPNCHRLEINDDGIGLRDQAETKQGLGFRIMKYRAGLIGGILQIEAQDKGGTVVTLKLPRRTGDEFNPTES